MHHLVNTLMIENTVYDSELISLTKEDIAKYIILGTFTQLEVSGKRVTKYGMRWNFEIIS